MDLVFCNKFTLPRKARVILASILDSQILLMDSLTQIILGAATGEVVLGKKIGNRAMLWGAVGGTIPDLDVMGKFFLSNIDNLAFHRGISHSIFFAIVGAFVFGWMVHNLYKSKYHLQIALVTKALATILVGFAAHFVFNIFMPGNYLPTILFVAVLVGALIISSKRRYFSDSWEAPEANLRDWQWLFFWSIFTHPILDCFTMYGTQLFAPFSDTRIAWGTVSVVDPLYSVPFLICLIVASFYIRTSKKRRVWNYVGIAVSSAYLSFTVINKQHMKSVFSAALAKQNIPIERFLTGPTILNNILWNCTAETKDFFYVGQFSLFDNEGITFSKLEKNHSMIHGMDSDKTIKTLRWFSNNYFNVIKVEEGYQFNDLRFGTFKGEALNKDDYIFKFLLTKNGSNRYKMEEAKGGPPKGGAGPLFWDLIHRIFGRK